MDQCLKEDSILKTFQGMDSSEDIKEMIHEVLSGDPLSALFNKTLSPGICDQNNPASSRTSGWLNDKLMVITEISFESFGIPLMFDDMV